MDVSIPDRGQILGMDVSGESAASRVSQRDNAREYHGGEGGANSDTCLGGGHKGVLTPRKGHGWEGLEVKESLLEGAGDGLFTTASYKKGETVCEYVSIETANLTTKVAIKLEVISRLVCGLGFRVESLWFRVDCLGFRV